MKTSTSAVVCDGCGAEMPVQLSGSAALYLTLRGQSVGHLKADFCNADCLAAWAAAFKPSPGIPSSKSSGLETRTEPTTTHTEDT